MRAIKTKEFVEKVHHYYQGDTDYPVPSTDGQYELYISIANDLIADEWADDPDNKWSENWEERTFGTVSSSKEYSVDDDVSSLSDYVYIDTPSSGTAKFSVVDPEDREDAVDAVYLHGNNPQLMTFTGEMAANLIGGTIRAGVYFVPQVLKNPGNIISLKKPLWLIYRTAAELSRNDPAKEDQYANLIGLANQQWEKMVSIERKAGPGRPKRIRHTRSRMRRRF